MQLINDIITVIGAIANMGIAFLTIDDPLFDFISLISVSGIIIVIIKKLTKL